MTIINNIMLTKPRNNSVHRESLITSIRSKNVKLTLVKKDGTAEQRTWPLEYAIQMLTDCAHLFWCPLTQSWHTMPCDCNEAHWNDAIKKFDITVKFGVSTIEINVGSAPKLRTVIQRDVNGKILYDTACGKLSNLVQKHASTTWHSVYIDNLVDFKHFMHKVFNDVNTRFMLEELVAKYKS